MILGGKNKKCENLLLTKRNCENKKKGSGTALLTNPTTTNHHSQGSEWSQKMALLVESVGGECWWVTGDRAKRFQMVYLLMVVFY